MGIISAIRTVHTVSSVLLTLNAARAGITFYRDLSSLNEDVLPRWRWYHNLSPKRSTEAWVAINTRIAKDAAFATQWRNAFDAVYVSLGLNAPPYMDVEETQSLAAIALEKGLAASVVEQYKLQGKWADNLHLEAEAEIEMLRGMTQDMEYCTKLTGEMGDMVDSLFATVNTAMDSGLTDDQAERLPAILAQAREVMSGLQTMSNDSREELTAYVGRVEAGHGRVADLLAEAKAVCGEHVRTVKAFTVLAGGLAAARLPDEADWN